MEHTNLIIDASAIVISVLALFLTLYSVRQQQQFERKSVCPFLSFYDDVVRKTYSLDIVNAGLGPLIINRMYYEKEKTTSTFINGLINVLRNDYITQYNLNGYVLGPGEKSNLITCEFSSFEALNDFGNDLFNTTIHVLYTDVYQEKEIHKSFDLGEGFKIYLEARKGMGTRTKNLKD